MTTEPEPQPEPQPDPEPAPDPADTGHEEELERLTRPDDDT